VEYTRYADDMLFSSKNLNFGEKKWFLKKIRYILYQNGFMLNYSKEKIAETEISLNGFVVSNSIRLSRKRFLDIKHIVLLCKKQLGTQPLEDKVTFLKNVNNTKLVYRDLSKYPFLSIDQIVQYLSGYRSFFISWIDEFDKNTANQKQIMKSIRIIEKIFDKLDKKYIS
jgi:hypothetical protein